MMNFIAIDLSSIVKLDENIKALDSIQPSFTQKSDVDQDSIDVIKYAIKAGGVFPIYLGQVAPLFYTSLTSAVQNLGISKKFIIKYFTFSKSDIFKFKEDICKKYNKNNVIRFAYDKTESNIVWEQNNIEVLD